MNHRDRRKTNLGATMSLDRYTNTFEFQHFAVVDTGAMSLSTFWDNITVFGHNRKPSVHSKEMCIVSIDPQADDFITKQLKLSLFSYNKN